MWIISGLQTSFYTMTPVQHFKDTLNRFKWLHALSLLVRYLFSFFSGFTVVLLVSGNVIHASGKGSAGYAALVLCLGFVSAGLIFCFVVCIKALWAALPEMSRTMEAAYTELGSAITGAHDLSSGSLHGASSEFAGMHIGFAEAKAEFVLKNEVKALNQGFRRFLLILPMLVVITEMIMIYPGLLGDISSLLVQDKTKEIVLVQNVEAPLNKPIIGDIVIHYRFPAYTGLKEKIEKNRAGRIRCIKGTSVTFIAQCNTKASAARVEMKSGMKVAVAADSTALSFSAEIMASDQYELFMRDTIGIEHSLLSDSIVCLPDEYPAVQLQRTADQILVRKRESLPIAYHASDDFGIKAVSLLAIKNGSDRRVALEEGKGRRDVTGQLDFDLSQLNLTEGDNVVLFVEAADNDGVSGSKKALSSPLHLTVLDEGRAHFDVEQKLAQLVQKMVLLLADHLEEGFSSRMSADNFAVRSAGFDAKSYDLLQEVQELLGLMQADDKTSDEIYSSIVDFNDRFLTAVEGRKKAMTRAQADFSALATAEESEIRELENIIFFLDQAKEREKVGNVLSDAEELMRQMRELEDKLKNNAGDKMRESEEYYNALKKELAGIFEKLMKNRKQSGLPEEFLNADAMKNIPANQLEEQLKRIEQAMKSGDADAALAEMLKLRDLIDQLYAALNQAAGQFADEKYARDMQAMQKAMEELDMLIKRQSHINTAGDEVLEKLGQELQRLLQEAEQRLQQKIMALFNALLERLKRLVPAFVPEKQQDTYRKSMADILKKTVFAKNQYAARAGERSLFELKNAGKLYPVVRSCADTLAIAQEIDTAEAINRTLISLLENSDAAMAGMLPQESKDALNGLANEEGSILDKLNAMAQAMKSMIEGMGPSGAQMSENMGNASSALGASFNRFSAYNLPSAMPSAKSGLYYLMQLRQGMQSAMAQMKQGSGLMPSPYGMGKGRNRSGRSGIADGFVPMQGVKGKESELKEKIKDAIKEKGPVEYEKENKDYYEKLGN